MKKLLVIMFLSLNTFTFGASEITQENEYTEIEFFSGQIIEKEGEKKVVSKDTSNASIDEVFNNDDITVAYPTEKELKSVLQFYNQYKGSEYIQGTREEFLDEIIAGAIQKKNLMNNTFLNIVIILVYHQRVQEAVLMI